MRCLPPSMAVSASALGLALSFEGKASTGGLDLAAQLLHRYTGVRLGSPSPL